MSSRSPSRRLRLLLVGGAVDLEQRDRHGPGGERLDHRQRPRHPRLVNDKEVPVGVGAER